MARRRTARTPIVVTSHGGDIYALIRRSTRASLRCALRGACAVTVVSTSRAEIAAGLEKTAANPTGIPMGVDTQRFHPNRLDTSWFADAGLTRPLILFVGRLTEKKGIISLTDAMLRPELVAFGAALAITGDGPLRENLERRGSGPHMAGRVRFLGAIALNRLPGHFAAADVVAVPSIGARNGGSAGLPTVVLEALAGVTAVVASQVAGIAGAIEDGVTGRRVTERDADALTRASAQLIGDHVLRDRLTYYGLRRVQRFSWERIGEAYEDVLHAALAQPARGS